MAKNEQEIKRLEEIISAQYQKIGELVKVADNALSALEVRGLGAAAHPIRQELNKLKP